MGSCGPRNLRSLLWQVSPPRFIWVCRISRWTPAQLPRASASRSRLPRQIRSVRAAPFILALASIPYALFTRYWPIWQSGVMGRPSVFLSKRATSLMYSTHQLALANHGLCWKFWKFFKPQLSNRCSHRCWPQWYSRSFNSGAGAVEKQCLSVLHQNSLCGRSISLSDAGVIGLCLPRWSS